MKYINLIMRETELLHGWSTGDRQQIWHSLCIVVVLMCVLLYLVCLVHRERRGRSSAHSQVVAGVTDSTGGQSHLCNQNIYLLDILALFPQPFCCM